MIDILVHDLNGDLVPMLTGLPVLDIECDHCGAAAGEPCKTS